MPCSDGLAYDRMAAEQRSQVKDETINFLGATLCAFLSGMEQQIGEGLELKHIISLDWEEAGIDPLEVIEWWDEHKREDEWRKAEEAELAAKKLEENQAVTDYWAKYYVDEACVLCGNTGFIDTVGRAITPAGLHVGSRVHCICPNGQTIRYQQGKD